MSDTEHEPEGTHEHKHEGSFAEGQEEVEHHPEDAPESRYARGQRKGADPEHWHEGEFAEGQEKTEHHPEAGTHGDFAEGQEKKD